MKYYILNEIPTVYFDPYSKLKVLSKDRENPTEHDGPITDHIRRALTGGHIIEVFPERKATSSPAQEAPESKSLIKLKAKLTKMTPEARAKYYKDEFEDVSDKDLEAFKAMTPEKQVEFLLD